MARLKDFITEGIIWRYGVHISRGASESIITIDKIDKKIEILMSGEERKNLLFIVRDVIKKLNSSYSNLIVSEFVLEGENNVRINYQELKGLQDANEKTYFVSSIREKIDIEKLIEQVEPESKKELDPIKIFISYSHKDSDYKTELLSHLSPLIRLNEVAVWEDGKLVPGQQWKSEILLRLDESDIVLCLISSDFISSEFCYSIELKEALTAHSKNEKVVIPVLIRKCFWEKLPIAQLQGVPIPPISSQDNADEGWSDVVIGVDKSLNLIRELKYGKQQ
ncbi:MAG: toll/interleukin-1 receptor domain-containing protein [Cyanobacteria bacterium P01_F01_bin.86]